MTLEDENADLQEVAKAARSTCQAIYLQVKAPDALAKVISLLGGIQA